MVTVLTALITACSTAIPTILITYFNHKTSIKMKKLETYESSKKQAVSEFINNALSCTNVITKDNEIYNNFLKSTYNLYFYFPELIDELETLIDCIDEYYDDNDYLQSSLNKLTDIVKKLSISTLEKL